jgi:pimeloyl-[acyl-carrier protein] methyl ester esterase
VSLILLPGLDGTGILFRPLVAALPAHIKPVVVGYPGDQPLNYQQLFPRVLDALSKTEPFIILGESFSGPLAAMVAAQHPKGLIGLILCVTFVTSPQRFVGPVVPFLSRAPAYYLYPFFQRFKARLGGYASPELLKLISDTHNIVQPHVIAARVRTVFAVDATAALRSCEVPILYLQAARDRVVPARNLRIIQQIVPNVQVARIDTTHMVLQRRPAESAEVITKFADSLP